MSKTLLHRLLGFGRFPKAMRPILEKEGVVLADEGIGGSLTFRNFRAPGRRYTYRKTWFTGSIVITEQRFAAFAFNRPVINVPLGSAQVRKLHCTVEKGGSVFHVSFDPSDFHDDWSGRIDCRFRTPKATQFFDWIRT